MDLLLIISLVAVVVLLILSVLFLFKSGNTTTDKPVDARRRLPGEVDADRPRRAQIVRNQRTRLRAQANARNEEIIDEDNNSETESALELGDEKIGAKKRAKLEAKAEKKAQRELEEKVREDKKKRELQAEEERLKLLEKEKADEKAREELERKEREELERKEYEEYLKMKEAFAVEEEGFEDDSEESEHNSLQSFISYIKDNKVIVIEDLAVKFKLKTQAAIDRIQDLQKDGLISGVIDDRGKYIYVSQKELEAVAKFIKQRGRVSLSELVDSSSKLINLQPNQIPIQT